MAGWPYPYIMIDLCLIFGGTSSEHEVSLRSVTSVIKNVDREKYNLILLGITKSGRWLMYNGPVELIESGRWQSGLYTRPAVISPDRSHKGLILLPYDEPEIPSQRLRNKIIADMRQSKAGYAENLASGLDVFGQEPSFVNIDVVFPVLHGKYGEDGTVQGLLELAGIRYVGCKVLPSAACMDKETTHIMLENAGINMAKTVTIKKADAENMADAEKLLANKLGYPMFVKPANAGSSVGITKVKSAEGLAAAFDTAFEHDEKIIVEQMVEGKEVECAVMGNNNPIASDALGEISSQNEFYDYNGKYIDDSTTLYIPARISEDIAQRVRETALKAYKTMGCTGLSRVDFFVKDDGEIVLNEINTLPGFTSISMYSKMFEASGVPYSQIVDALIGYALEK